MERPGKAAVSAAEKPHSAKLSREVLFLAEQAAEGRLKILPSTDWALHYPVDPATRAEKLQGLLEGKYKAQAVAQAITPDALLYNAEDIQRLGLDKVSGRIRDLSAFVAYYDYPRFAQFVESMRGHEVRVEDLDRLYSDVTQARVQKKVWDAYGYTGRKQIEESLSVEAKRILEGAETLSRAKKVLKTLKLSWIAEDMGLVSTEERDRMIARLSGEERTLVNHLQEPYRQYVQTGDEANYQKLLEAIREDLPKLKQDKKPPSPSESMQELDKELEPYKKDAVPPGSPEDPAIPPEDSDEYHTPPPSPKGGGESKEQQRERAIFEIKPPLGGYYVSGRKSYFDVDKKTWSKRKQLTPYSGANKGADASTISGVLNAGLKSIPIPAGYAMDAASLKSTGARPTILRDQNGCFYLEATGPCTFSVDFSREAIPHVSRPITEDLTPLYRGTLSAKTEQLLSRLIGTPVEKAEQARQAILANHFYPGGGDLDAAQALQYKLRTESTGDTYLQTLDTSEYLECYSANTKFIALMRKSGVPARLVIGHKVEGAKDGKSSITQSTGHAWSEIWDGTAWRRFDATPQPKPEDKKDSKKKDEKEKKDPAPEAQDGGVENKDQGKDSQDGQPDSGQPGDKQKSDGSSKQGEGKPTDQLSDASDDQMKKSESELEQASKEMQKNQEEKQKLDDKADKADSFKDLADTKKEIEKSELFEDQKKELNDKLEAKAEQMKEQLKDELDKMVEDGFMDEKRRDELLEQLEKKQLEELDKLQKEVERENKLYTEYDNIKEEIMPLVDEWFEYFAERLPRHDEVNVDEDSLMRQGAFNRRAVMKARNLVFGTVKNPREFRSSIKPRYMASILIDVSGSMAGEKLNNARKLLVFYSELFSRISEKFGYIRSSISIFSDSVTQIKGFEHEYDSPQRYAFGDGTNTTVKARLMQKLATQGGTNMLDAIKQAAYELNRQVEDYPDHASAFYFVGDGEDTCGNSDTIKRFLVANDNESGFGQHMYSAILLGQKSHKQTLAKIFGDAHTNVAPDFDQLIEESMHRLEDDLEDYFKTKTT